MKKLLLGLILLATLLNSKDFKNISLDDFVQILSHATNKNFVITDSVNKDFHIYLPNYDFNNKKLSLKLLHNILLLNALDYKSFDNVFLIYKPKPKKPKKLEVPKPPELHSYIIKFKYLTRLDINAFFKLFPSVKHTILQNRIFTLTDVDTYKKLLKQINLLDNSYLQRNIQVTILSTVNTKNKDLGIDFKALHIDASKYISLLTSKVSFATPLTSTTQFYTFINAMKEKGYTTIIDNPNITLSDRKNAVIESTQNIPYLTTTTSTKDNTTTTRDSYDYKDVGLKINFKNVVITKDYIDVDLDIYIQSILQQSITPTIGSRHIQTHITLDKNSSVVLGGLTSKLNYKRNVNIPVIEYVPLLNKITSHDTSEVKDETFTIIINN